MVGSITFETKCYEKDWRLLLKTDYLAMAVERCRHWFDRKLLYINNVENMNAVKHAADKAVSKGIIDEYVVVQEYAPQALAFFGIDFQSFRGGYYYSIAELVSIYLAKTAFVLHFFRRFHDGGFKPRLD